VRHGAADRRADLVWPRAGCQRREALPISKHDNIIGYPDHYVQSTERHPMDYLAAKLIGERGLGQADDRRRDGQLLVLGRGLRLVAKTSAECPFVDATALVNWQRAVKSETEIDYMRKAARIVETMHQRIVDTIESACANAISSRKSTTPARAA
jgi:Xaa-Pro aminopeptidase